MGAATAFPLPEGLAMNEIGGSMIMPVMTDTSLCLSVIAAWKGVEYLMGHSPAFAHLAYETQALQSLRRKLLDQGPTAVTDEAILSAVLLWATATMFAQPDALRRHAAGVQALVAARGGLSAIGRAGSIGQAASIRQLILWADFLTAQFLGEDVLFGEPGPTGAADDDAPMPPSVAKLSVVAAVPASFNSLLGPETLKAARDMKLLLVSHDTATRTGRLSIAEYKYLMQLLNKSTIERISLAYRLRGSHSLDEAVVLAMNLLRLTTLFHAGPLVPIVVAVISRLRKTLAYMTTLKSIDTLPPSGGGGITDDSYSSSSSHSSPFPPHPPSQPSSPDYIDLYIWTCFVGLVNAFESENRSHFIEMLSTALARRYRYRYRYRHGYRGRDASWPDDWQRDILEMLRSFLWSDVVLTPLFPDACLMIESYVLSPTSSGGVRTSGVIEGWSVSESDKSSRGGKS
ncbi:hypothetical protein AYO21_04799 [Fonsecaea monophora]|uniref:Transcription factor domain-containing protein n=1 Tax=Fonsecaea monophora TaxID=254056 RepID=A0A177F9M4_9EURO|nr:hypothetical protein AYO21_04799 [Fonsecaea monophora]OAG40957.1 hypothetical protein AYO21_04799 [Fonsecaea monophora]